MINLVRAVQNNKNQLIPENYEFCPRYNHDKTKLKCIANKECKCMGIDDGSVIKKIGDNKFLIQCNYWCD